MPVCPICDTHCQQTSACCPTCGWDVTPESLEAVSRQPSHLDWARSLWQQFQTRQPQQTEPTNSLAIQVQQFQAQLHLAERERSHLQQQLDWVLYRLQQLERQPEFPPEMPMEPATEDPPLASAVGWNYDLLQRTLAQPQWSEAEQLTWDAMLNVARGLGWASDRDWLTLDEIAQFPQEDFESLDRLWYAYSDGRFGLSAQLQIWWDCQENYTEFCDRVGWRSGGNWVYYDDLTFQIAAPVGHLPVLPWRKRACYGTGRRTAAETFAQWMERFAQTQVV